MQIFGKNSRADVLRMQGIIKTTQNLIFTQVSQYTLDYMHVKAGLDDLV